MIRIKNIRREYNHAPATGYDWCCEVYYGDALVQSLSTPGVTTGGSIKVDGHGEALEKFEEMIASAVRRLFDG